MKIKRIAVYILEGLSLTFLLFSICLLFCSCGLIDSSIFNNNDNNDDKPKSCTYHTYGDWQVSIEATCITEGEKYRICSVCGKKVVSSIDKGAHDYGEPIVLVEATCTQKGKQKVVCKVCDNELVTVTSIKPHTYELDENNEKIEYQNEHVCGEEIKHWSYCTSCKSNIYVTSPVVWYYPHEYGGVVVDSPATCLEAGERSKHCKYCSERTDIVTIPRLQHKFGSYVTIQVENCTQEGIYERTCLLCNTTKRETENPLGHNWFTTSTPPTCIAEGQEKRKCKRCNLVTTETIAVNPNNHRYGAFIVDDIGDCGSGKKGSQHRICSLCDHRHEEPYYPEHDYNSHTLLCNRCSADYDNDAAKEKLFEFQYGDTEARIVDYIGKGRTKVRVPSTYKGRTVTSLYAGHVFQNNKELEYIWLPETLTVLGDGEFKGCSALKELYIPRSVRKIGAEILAGCTSLKRLVIPFIGGLRSRSVNNGVNNYTVPPYRCFGYYFGDDKIDGTYMAQQYASDTVNNTKKYYIPSSLTTVYIHGGYMIGGSFDNCSSITDIVIGKWGMDSYGVVGQYRDWSFSDSCFDGQNVSYTNNLIEQSIFY